MSNAQQDQRAREIYQTHLDVSTRLVFERDGAAYCAHATLPYIFRTGSGETIIETEADLIADIEYVNNWLRSTGATDFFRIARQARFVAPDIIEGFHVSYPLRGAVPVVEPWTSRMILRRVDDHWRTTYGEHELADPLYDTHVARTVPGAFASEWQTDGAPQAGAMPEALPVYQAFLDVNSDHLNAGDFDRWANDFTLPYQVHYDTTDITVRAYSETRGFFDTVRASMADLGAEKMVRRAGFAAFVSPTRIFGYHDAVFTRDGTVCFGPVKSRMILTRDDGSWKCTAVTNGLTNTRMSGSGFEPIGTLRTIREIKERTRT